MAKYCSEIYVLSKQSWKRQNFLGKKWKMVLFVDGFRGNEESHARPSYFRITYINFHILHSNHLFQPNLHFCLWKCQWTWIFSLKMSHFQLYSASTFSGMIWHAWLFNTSYLYLWYSLSKIFMLGKHRRTEIFSFL